MAENNTHAPGNYSSSEARGGASAQGPVSVGAVVLVLSGRAVVVFVTAQRTLSRVLADDNREPLLSQPLLSFIPPQEKPDEELVLPGTLQAYVESPIYARTNGYLLRWYKDIGSHVKQGDLLADIDTPEVDQELMQARAARQQSRCRNGSGQDQCRPVSSPA